MEFMNWGPSVLITPRISMWESGTRVSFLGWANRENPITDSTANLTISSNGTLLLLGGKKHDVVWSIGETFSTNESRAELSDSGNLIVKDNVSGRTLWESFEHPGDTMLPLSSLTYNLTTGEQRVLTSWKSYTDPSPGDFVVQITPQVPSQMCTMRVSTPYWRSGPWAKTRFIGLPLMDATFTSPFSLQQDPNESVSFNYLRFIPAPPTVTPDGSLKLSLYKGNHLESDFKAPANSCEFYGACGPFGFCVMSVPPKCKCFKGFEPKSVEEWKRGNWTDGCVRRTELHCQGNSTGKEVNEFYVVPKIKPPDFYELARLVDAEECQKICLRNCSCLAFANIVGNRVLNVEPRPNRHTAIFYRRRNSFHSSCKF